MRIGLALGGGVALGFYHLGVLKALKKIGVKIDIVSGTSIGAIMGGLYALTLDVKEVEERIFSVIDQHNKELSLLKGSFSQTNIEAKTAFLEKWFDLAKEFYIWNLRIAKSSLVDLRPFLKIFRKLFGDYYFNDCKIPFCVTTVNLLTGEIFPINKGPLYKGVLASSSYPGFFPPIKLDDKFLIDGGVLMPVPARIIRAKSDFIIGINLESSGYRFPHIRNAMDVMNLADRIRYKKIIEESLQNVDFLVSPNLENFSWGDFGRAKELVQKGESEILSFENKLKDAMKLHKYKRFFSLTNCFKPSFHLKT